MPRRCNGIWIIMLCRRRRRRLRTEERAKNGWNKKIFDWIINFRRLLCMPRRAATTNGIFKMKALICRQRREPSSRGGRSTPRRASCWARGETLVWEPARRASAIWPNLLSIPTSTDFCRRKIGNRARSNLDWVKAKSCHPKTRETIRFIEVQIPKSVDETAFRRCVQAWIWGESQ